MWSSMGKLKIASEHPRNPQRAVARKVATGTADGSKSLTKWASVSNRLALLEAEARGAKSSSEAK